MMEQNQNQNLFGDMDQPTMPLPRAEEEREMEEPALQPRETVEATPEKLDINIEDATEKTEFKDLEISFNFEKIELIKKIVRDTENNLRRIRCILGEESPKMEEKIKKSFLGSDLSSMPHVPPEVFQKTVSAPEIAYGESGERIIEGVFNGQNMIGADGKEYIVPANYASKSKLVEGDILKLTINARGNFLFKQIGPIERTRIVGALEESEAGGFCIVSGNKKWKVLTAPVTYFKGEPGDEAVILIPKNTPSKWAAVENVIKRIEV